MKNKVCESGETLKSKKKNTGNPGTFYLELAVTVTVPPELDAYVLEDWVPVEVGDVEDSIAEDDSVEEDVDDPVEEDSVGVDVAPIGPVSVVIDAAAEVADA